MEQKRMPRLLEEGVRYTGQTDSYEMSDMSRRYLGLEEALE